MTVDDLERAIEAASRLHRSLIEYRAYGLAGNNGGAIRKKESAHIGLETLALAMGRKIEEPVDA